MNDFFLNPWHTLTRICQQSASNVEIANTHLQIQQLLKNTEIGQLVKNELDFNSMKYFYLDASLINLSFSFSLSFAK